MTNTTERLIEMYENELEGLALMRDLSEVPAAEIDQRERELLSAIDDLQGAEDDICGSCNGTGESALFGACSACAPRARR